MGNRKYNRDRGDLAIVGGTYSNKGGLAIVHGTFKVFKELGINFKYMIDPELSFPPEFFTSFNLIPIYRYSNVLWKKPTSSVNPIHTFYPFVKCLINSYKSQIRQLQGIPMWYIGDSSLNDYRSILSLFGQIISLKSLKMAINGKLIIGGISLGRSRTRIGKLALQHFFKSVDYFFVRGWASYHNLIKLGVPHNKISIVCDFAFYLDQRHSSRSEKYSKLIRNSDNPPIALIFREYSHGRIRENYIKAIKKLVSKLRDYKIFFIPTSYSSFTPENDMVFLRKLQKILNIGDYSIINIENFSPGEIIHIFSNFDVVISARLHGAVYGALAGIPTIHLYDAHNSLDVIKDTFGEVIPLIKLSNFAKKDISSEIVGILKDLLHRKNEISLEITSRIKRARESSIVEFQHTLEEKRLLE